jgi:hypothetical protein
VLKKAEDATDNYTKYYKMLGKGNLTSIEEIVREFKEKYNL